jgi:hypothetical protein
MGVDATMSCEVLALCADCGWLILATSDALNERFALCSGLHQGGILRASIRCA